MLKFMGIICILCGCTGMGFACARELELRTEELGQLKQSMLLLKGDIRYMQRPLADALVHLADSAQPPFGEFFLRTAQDLQMCRGRTACEIWRNNVRECARALHISKQEAGELEKLGNMLGCLDTQMQVNALDYYLEQLGVSIRQALEAARSRRRLYRYMGVLGGAALAVILI